MLVVIPSTTASGFNWETQAASGSTSTGITPFSSKPGTFSTSARRAEIGSYVEAGETAGYVSGVPVVCTISGTLRGLLADNVLVTKGMKTKLEIFASSKIR